MQLWGKKTLRNLKIDNLFFITKIVQVCELLSRHVWAVGRSFSQIKGPPQGEDEEEEEKSGDEEKKGIVTLSMEILKKD